MWGENVVESFAMIHKEQGLYFGDGKGGETDGNLCQLFYSCLCLSFVGFC